MKSLDTKNSAMVERAQAVIPGGVNSTNRMLPWDMVTAEARGAYFTDVDGNRYLDYHAAFGPLILGHNDPGVNAAVTEALERVDIMGVAVTEQEIELAETLVELIPSAEQVLLTNSGSEATYAALRLARATTGKTGLIKFQGTYHGWHDSVLMNVISEADKIGQRDPLSRGMLDETVKQTTVLPFNDTEQAVNTIRQKADELAAVIVEIIPHNIGCVMPKPEFLEGLRKVTEETGVLLIFDEVVTGFRHDLGGYQNIVGITPDLSTFAKAMANGYPIAALVGKEKYMSQFGPGGGVVFAGTYNGHPVGVAAALATIERLRDGQVHQHCATLAKAAADGIEEIALELGVPITVARFGSVFVPYFMEGPIVSYTDLLRNDTQRDLDFRTGMCREGIFMIPTAIKRNHISAAHTQEDVDRTLEAARRVLKSLRPSVEQ